MFRTLICCVTATLTLVSLGYQSSSGREKPGRKKKQSHYPLVTEVREHSAGAGEPLLRIAPPADDGFDGPNPRDISNQVCFQLDSLPNVAGFSDAVWAWGQFIDHDIDLTETDPANGDASILVLDPFDPLSPIIPFTRSNYVEIGGVRQQVNQITAYLDASNIYGSDDVTAGFLRDTDGYMLSDNGLLPYDGFAFYAGDVRANENVVLTSLHTLFVREHNRLVKLIEKHAPGADEEEIFQLARKIVGAELQIITYKEFLPTLLGPAAPRREDYAYQPAVNPGIANEFSGALYRVGHTMLSADLIVKGEGILPLRNAFFNPSFLADDPDNVERLLAGLSQQAHQEIDAQLVEDVRSFLFGSPGAGGLDLASLNIQRGRDHALPDYNTARVYYGLPPVVSFAEITSDPELQLALEDIYGDVDHIDLWIGGLAEDHAPGANVGPLVLVSLADQFTRLRDGDPFFHVGDFDLKQKLVRQIIKLDDVTLSQVTRWNTGAHVPRNMFVLKTSQVKTGRKRRR